MEAVILAAGLGKRMKPLSYVLPKPLFRLGDKTIIEHIIDWLKSNGVGKIHIVLSYSGRLVESYLKNKKEVDINFIYSEPKGTAGQLIALKEHTKSTFIVNYCDSLFNFDLKGMIDFHIKNKSVLTLASIKRSIPVNYGVLTYTKDGILKRWDEKPSIELNVFTGLFIAEPLIFGYLNRDEILHLNDLVIKMIKNKERIFAYEIPGEYYDVGTLKRYIKILKVYDSKIGKV